MAHSRRRATVWRGATLDDQAITVDGTSEIELLTANDLEGEEEPTIVRLIGQLQIGSGPASVTASHVVNTWWGIRLGDITASAVDPKANIGGESYLRMGFLRSVWLTIAKPMFTSAGAWVSDRLLVENQVGSWEYERWESHAMRRVRQGESLILDVRAESPSGTPNNIVYSGFVRALLKRRS